MRWRILSRQNRFTWILLSDLQAADLSDVLNNTSSLKPRDFKYSLFLQTSYVRNVWPKGNYISYCGRKSWDDGSNTLNSAYHKNNIYNLPVPVAARSKA
jgi:hypothetical protein